MKDAQNVRSRNESTYEGSRHWRPRRFSYIAIGFVLLAILSFGFLALSIILKMNEGSSIGGILVPFVGHPALMMILATTFSVLAVVVECVSRFRTPAPAWRVKQDLIRALVDLSLLNANDTTMWKGAFRCSPKGRYNRETHSYEILFLLRSVNATEEKFQGLEDSIAGFTGAEDVSIERLNNGHSAQSRIFNHKLTIWYTGNPYENTRIFED